MIRCRRLLLISLEACSMPDIGRHLSIPTYDVERLPATNPQWSGGRWTLACSVSSASMQALTQHM